jgi:hypothetical protein
MHSRRVITSAVAIATAVALTACGGGGGGGSVAPTSANAPGSGTGSGGSSGGSNSKAAQSVQVNMHIPGASSTASATKRSPQFVASSTQGVLVVVYATSDTGHTTPLGSSATNVAPGSAACGGASGARTCSVTIPAPPGQDDFVFTTYDQPPSSGTTFSGSAHLLATGTVTNQTISAATANVVNVTLSGAIASLTASPYDYAFVAGTGPHTYTQEITAYDAGGNVIIGSYVDGNGNADPITITVTETGGSGLTTISTNGSTFSNTATLASSSTVATVSYTGGGSPPYYATLAAVAASGQSISPTFNPLYVSSTSTAYTGGTNPAINLTAPNQSITITFSEANSNYFTTAPSVGSNCTGVATVSAATSTSPTFYSFTVTGSSAGGSCVISIYDGAVNDNIALTAVGNTTSTVAVPGSLLVYTADGPGGVGIRTTAGTQVGHVTTLSSADNIALDNAGNLYVLSDTTGLSKYVPSAGGYPPTYTNSGATYNITNLSGVVTVQASGDGEIVVNEDNASYNEMIYDIWDPGQTGAPSRTITLPDATGVLLYFGHLTSSGELYAAGTIACGIDGGYHCVQYEVIPEGSSTPTRTFQESLVSPQNQANFSPSYESVGGDGTLYVSEWNYGAGDINAGVYIYPPSGQETHVTQGASSPSGIDVDLTGNIYVANNNITFNAQGVQLSPDTAHTFNVLSPDGKTILRSINLLPGPAALAVNGDGTAFVSDAGVYSILPNAGTGTQIDSYSAYNIVIYDGTGTRSSLSRTPLSIGSGTAHGGSAVYRRRH